MSDELTWGGSSQHFRERDVDQELLRLKRAFEETPAELERSAERIALKFDTAPAGIFLEHLKQPGVFPAASIKAQQRAY